MDFKCSKGKNASVFVWATGSWLALWEETRTKGHGAAKLSDWIKQTNPNPPNQLRRIEQMVGEEIEKMLDS